MIICIRPHNFKIKNENKRFAPGAPLSDPKHQSWALEHDYASHVPDGDEMAAAVAIASAEGKPIRKAENRVADEVAAREAADQAVRALKAMQG